MSEMMTADEIIRGQFKNLDKDFQKKILRHSIFKHWKEIAGSISNDVFPVKIEDETVILYSQNSAAKDNLKFLSKEIIDNANKIVGQGEELFKNIAFAKSFVQVKNFPQKNISAAEIELTAEEIADCHKKVSDIKNSKIKKVALETFIGRKKSDKQKIQSGWHKCKLCNVLCKPEEIICQSCKVSEKNKLRDEIRQIFLKEPSISFQEVLAQCKKIFPHLANECTLPLIGSERSALIVEIAARVSFGDRDSELAKFLVMLYRRLPKDKLTDSIIKRALKELRFNLADQPSIKVSNSDGKKSIRIA